MGNFSLLKPFCIFIICYLLLSLLLHLTNFNVSRLFVPIWPKVIDKAIPNCTVKKTYIQILNHHTYVNFVISIKRSFIIKNPDNGKSEEIIWTFDKFCGFAVAGLNIYLLLNFSLLFVWPNLKIQKKILSAVIMAFLIFMIFMIDVPLHVSAKIEPDALTFYRSWKVEAIPKNKIFIHFIRFIYIFLNQGGRYFLSFVIFIISISPHYLKISKDTDD